MIYKFLLLLSAACAPLHLCANQENIRTEFACEQAVKGPLWMQDAVIYSIFPRNFSKTGDFNGISQCLDRIKELGADVIWLLPIHPIGEVKKKGTIGSPYAIQDYEKINPAYGSSEDLKNLVMKAHALGLKVIIDAVLNHTAWDCVLMKNPDFYRHDENHRIIPPHPDWIDVAGLDYTNPALQSYILNVLKYWLQEFDLDGFRFDASDFVPIEFWKKMRKELLQLNPDILLLGEGEKPEALCSGFDLDYDWKFKRTLDSIIIDGAPATITMEKMLKEQEALFPQGSLHLRFSDNHDERRAIVRYGEKGTLAASVLIFTMNGVPLIYNGMEVGDTTESRDPALFEKMPIFWDASMIRPEFTSFYTQMISLRKKHPVLRQGKLQWLKNTSEERILTYLRTSEEETLLVAINLSNQPFIGKLDLKGTFEDLTPKKGTAASSLSSSVLSLGAWDYCIYKVHP